MCTKCVSVFFQCFILVTCFLLQNIYGNSYNMYGTFEEHVIHFQENKSWKTILA